jgi:hypothetical protein
MTSFLRYYSERSKQTELLKSYYKILKFSALPRTMQGCRTDKSCVDACIHQLRASNQQIAWRGRSYY